MRTEDTALITRRVMFATEQCLLVLTHHPAVWHQAAQFLDQSSKALTDKGVRIVFSYPIYFQFQQFVLCLMTQQNQDIIIIKRLLIMKLDRKATDIANYWRIDKSINKFGDLRVLSKHTNRNPIDFLFHIS